MTDLTLSGRWNLDLGDIVPALGVAGGETVPIELARFDIGETEGGATIRRSVPALRVGERGLARDRRGGG